jgi:hypothetical protein
MPSYGGLGLAIVLLLVLLIRAPKPSDENRDQLIALSGRQPNSDQ